jgi:hypothetical protein
MNIEKNKKRKPEFEGKWILDRNGNPIQVNAWQSSNYRHGSDWDYSYYVEDMDGNKLKTDAGYRLENQSKEKGKFSWVETFGYNTKEEALKQK